MKVILTKNVPGLGKINDIVDVNDGYGKNYLIKNNLATLYNQVGIHKLNERIKEDEANEEQNLYNANLLKNEIESNPLKFLVKTNNGKSIGFITNKAIMTDLNKTKKLVTKFMFDRNYKLGLGESLVRLNIYKNVHADLKVIVEEIK